MGKKFVIFFCILFLSLFIVSSVGEEGVPIKLNSQDVKIDSITDKSKVSAPENYEKEVIALNSDASNTTQKNPMCQPSLCSSKNYESSEGPGGSYCCNGSGGPGYEECENYFSKSTAYVYDWWSGDLYDSQTDSCINSDTLSERYIDCNVYQDLIQSISKNCSGYDRYYDYVFYCTNNEVRKKRYFRDWGCSSGACKETNSGWVNDQLVSQKGADNYCTKRKEGVDNGWEGCSLCSKGDYDCNWDSECSGSLECIGPVGGALDGCCNPGETWDTSLYECCECTSGSCCDGCHYRTSSSVCDSHISGSDEYKCWGNCLDDDVMKRYQKQYCSGSSSSCTGTKEWVQYSDENCLSTQFCKGSTSWGTTRPSCSNAQCTSGDCCDTACGEYDFLSSNWKCKQNMNWYGCPWGNDLEDDVGKKIGNQYCTGSSSECNGNINWGSWTVKQNCNNEQYCEGTEGLNELWCKTIMCSSDNNCPSDEWVNRKCLDIVVWATFNDYKCYNPGTKQSYCNSTSTFKKMEECGENGYVGDPYCSNYNMQPSVFQDYATRWCGDNNCKESIDLKLIKICQQGCTNGICNEDNCNNECDSGVTTCTADNFLLTCGNYDTDSCFEWSSPDDCNDCSCSCGGYNKNESSANSNCNDNKDNDCDGKIDGQDSGCVIINCSSDLQCGNPGWKNIPSCSNNDSYDYYVTPTCRNPGTINSSCYNQEEFKIKQDCGDDSYSANYCDDNDVYRNFTDRGCLNGACFVNTTKQKFQECGSAGCSNNKCNMACSINSDCGINGWTGSLSCSNNDVFQNYRNYTCNNPGQANANCSYSDSFRLKQDCGDDSCLICGNSFCFGDNYCKNGNVYHNYTCYDKGCLNGACFSNAFINESLVQNCGSAGCSNGKCNISISWLNPISGVSYRKTTCAESNILIEDSEFAGLARKSSETSVIYIDGQAVSSCIVADFGSVYNISGVRIRHFSPNNVCYDGCSSGYCNTGGTGKMFYSDEGTSWRYLAEIPRSTSFVWTNVSTNIKARYVLICRSSDSYKRDNLQVDNIQINTLIYNAACSKNSDCGSDGWTGSLSCSNNDVFQNYRNYTCNNPGQANANCSYKDNLQLKQDCGEDSYSSNFCYNNSVYRNFSDRGCLNNACFVNTALQKVQDCGSAGCSNNKCNINTTCSSNSDCGINGWTGSLSCSNNDIFQNYRNYTCNNPGQANANCSYSDSLKLKQDCGDDSCLICGNSFCFGDNYCKSGNVYHNYTCYDKGCLNNACFSNAFINESLVQNCGSAGCSNGKCNTSITWINPASGSSYRKTTCSENNILAEDSSYAGLARKSSETSVVYIDMQAVSSCIIASFNQSCNVKIVKIKHKSLNNVCNDGCSSGYCNTGGTGKMFYLAGSGSWKYLAEIPRSTSFRWTNVSTNINTNSILICRSSDSYKRDNLQVDNIQLGCA